MTPETASIVRSLARRIESLSAEESPAEAFRILLEASRDLAPRAAVFLVRHGELRGWGSVGFDAPQTAAIRAHRAPSDAGWLGHVASADGWIERPAGMAGDPGFSGADAIDSAGGPIRMRGRTMALLWAERDRPDQAWAPEALSMLLSIIRLRLELDLARRKLAREARPADAPRAAATSEARDTSRKNPAPVPTPASGSDPASDEPTAIEPAAPAESPDVEAARRFAKLIATDIRLYNEEAVMAGRRDGDLGNRLADDLDRGRQTFSKRHGKLGPSGLELLHEAYVQVLAGGDASLLADRVAD